MDMKVDKSHIFDGDDDPNLDPLYRKYIILPELGKRLMAADLNHEKELNNERDNISTD